MKLRGSWYDVTSFLSRHPGGDVILDYVDRDGTGAFEAFHPHPSKALKRVVKMKEGDVPPEVVADAERLEKSGDGLSKFNSWKGDDAAVARDFRRVLEDMKREGYYELNWPYLLTKMLVVPFFFGVGWYLAFSGTYEARLASDPTLIEWSTKLVPGSVCIALFLQQAGFLMHDFMHNNWFHDRIVDQMFGRFFGTICLGISAAWWRDEHNVHHAFVNTYEGGVRCRDVQMIEDVWAQNESLVQFFDGSIDEEVWKRKMDFLPLWAVNYVLNHQAIIWLPLTVGVGRIGIMLASFEREKRPLDRILQICHVIWVVLMLRAAFPTFLTGLLFYLLFSVGQGVLHIQLLVSHYAKPWHDVSQTKRPDQWYRWQVMTCINVLPLLCTAPHRSFDSAVLDYWDEHIAPWFDDWFHGGLNLHIEHHVYPTMPRNALRECRRRIKAVCEKHGIPYDERPFSTAVTDTLHVMNEVGMSVKFTDIVS